ncbi:MAG: hypothetical protein KBC15_02775 [Candidatus Levybacteria bacterium]|nr:hypothetical protein [Candidatus Levybacteria bacterium]
MKDKTYLVLLADRERASMFTLLNGLIISKKALRKGNVPQKVKHGDDTWDAQDKIFRHIEDHLHRRLSYVAHEVEEFAKENNVTDIVIGSHRPLFAKIEKHLPHHLQVQGKFVTELKGPFNLILKKASALVTKIEIEKKKGDNHK